jgi:hypothetical protein
VACEAEVIVATSRFFDLRNRKKARNFIQAEMTAPGYLSYYVENLPKDNTGCPGRWLFDLAWEHFFQRNVIVKGIRGEWSFADNLAMVNLHTAGNQVSVEEAAKHTWAYQRAISKGFATLLVLDADGSPGNYRSVDVLFVP